MSKNQRRKIFNIFRLFREYWRAPGYCFLYEPVSCLLKFTQISLRLHDRVLVHQ